MSGLDSGVRDDEFIGDVVPEEDQQDANLSLSTLELEYLEDLINAVWVVDHKGTNYTVDVKRDGNVISFLSYTKQGVPAVSFKYDLDARRVTDLIGADKKWVTEFLMRHRIVET